jgi:hypothetical protein
VKLRAYAKNRIDGVIYGSIINEDAVTEAFEAALEKIGKKMKADFEEAVEDWDHKPDFKIETEGSREVSITTDDEIFGYVDLGTRPHVIRPTTPGGVLAFPAGPYKRKTKNPGRAFVSILGAGSSGRRSSGGSGMIYTQEVHHPGTQPQRISEGIMEKWRVPFMREMNEVSNQIVHPWTGEVQPTFR